MGYLIRRTQSEAGICCLRVEDTALNDFLEDILWDHYRYESTTVDQPTRAAPVTYFNYFEQGVPLEELVAALKQIDVNEARRVFDRSGY